MYGKAKTVVCPNITDDNVQILGFECFYVVDVLRDFCGLPFGFLIIVAPDLVSKQ